MSSNAKTFRVVGAVLALLLGVWALSLRISGQVRADSVSFGAYYDQLLDISGAAGIDSLGKPFTLLCLNETVGSQSFESIWPLGGIRPRPPVAAPVRVISDDGDDTASGTGARAVQVNCLDAAGVPFSEILATNGTSLSDPTDGDCLRVQPSGVASHGSSPTNEGQILIVSDDGGTTYAVIPDSPIPAGGTRSCNYTVPAGHIVVARRLFAGTDDQGGLLTVALVIDLPVVGRRTISASVSGQVELAIGECYPEGADLDMLGIFKTGSGNLTTAVRLYPVLKPATAAQAAGQCPPS